jgi:hypothetical protein
MSIVSRTETWQLPLDGKAIQRSWWNREISLCCPRSSFLPRFSSPSVFSITNIPVTDIFWKSHFVWRFALSGLVRWSTRDAQLHVSLFGLTSLSAHHMSTSSLLSNCAWSKSRNSSPEIQVWWHSSQMFLCLSKSRDSIDRISSVNGIRGKWNWKKIIKRDRKPRFDTFGVLQRFEVWLEQMIVHVTNLSPLREIRKLWVAHLKEKLFSETSSLSHND